MAFPVRFNRSRYQRCLWIPPDLRDPLRCDDADEAGLALARIRRVIHFMDVTELQPTTHYSRLVRKAPGLPPYADHTLLWQDPGKRLLVTTEPYGMPRDVTAASGWRTLALPPGYGLWTAPTPEGHAQTEFIWLSPVKDSVDLEALAGRLMAAGPLPVAVPPE
jgi:hypothetical protein